MKRSEVTFHSIPFCKVNLEKKYKQKVPLHGCREPTSSHTCHTAGRADASLFPATSPSQLAAHAGVSQTTTRSVKTTWKPLTEIHLLVTSGTHVGLPGESGDAASWGQITVMLLGDMGKVHIVKPSRLGGK